MLRRIRRAIGLTLSAGLGATPVFASTYYVSPLGSDSNSGTSSAAPWSSVAKVDTMAFQPGDSILFQYGGTWNASLNATSSGTVAAPIIYSAYGNPALGNPIFSGSDPVSNAGFSNVTRTTYQMTAPVPVNWVFDNHQFTHEARDALTQAGAANPNDPTAQLNYVEQTPGSFFYNSITSQLYVNSGSTLTGHTLSLATRADAVFNNYQSNLIFQHLSVSETAQDNAGYGFRIQNGNNVKILDSAAYSTGKHAFGIINSTGYLGKNLLASGTQPDLGFGGASAFVSFSDATRQNDTSQWINGTYINPNGPYPALISHGNPGAIASLLVQNIVSLGGYGTGMDIYSTGPNEKVTVQGGQFNGGSIELDTSNSVINGITVGGDNGSISINGTNDVVQNSVFNRIAANPFAGHNGGVIDGGTNNTIRFNTFLTAATYGPAIAILNSSTKTNIYGNIVDYPGNSPGGDLAALHGPGTIQSGINVLNPSPTFFTGDVNHGAGFNLQQWQAMGYDTNSLVADPLFTNTGTGDFSLAANSPARGFFHGTIDPALTAANALLGTPNSDGSYNAGANPIYGGIGPAVVVAGQINLAGTGNGVTLFNSMSVEIVSGGKLTLVAAANHAQRSVLVTGALSFGGSTGALQGQLDLTTNDLVIHNGDIAAITNEIASGYNIGGVIWQGQGIISSASKNAPLTTLGVLLNSDINGNAIYNTFDGLPVINTDVLVKYTYAGDANLDGQVDGSDYTLIDNGFNNHLTGWFNGDFNYDGVIDGSDYTLIDNAFNMQDGSLNAAITNLIATVANVPEPDGFTTIALVGMILRRISRRRSEIRSHLTEGLPEVAARR